MAPIALKMRFIDGRTEALTVDGDATVAALKADMAPKVRPGGRARRCARSTADARQGEYWAARARGYRRAWAPSACASCSLGMCSRTRTRSHPTVRGARAHDRCAVRRRCRPDPGPPQARGRRRARTGITDGSTVHVVKAAANNAQADAAAAAAATAAPAARSPVGATAAGGPRPGIPASLSRPNSMAAMQQQLQQNPDMMRQLLNSPITA